MLEQARDLEELKEAMGDQEGAVVEEPEETKLKSVVVAGPIGDQGVYEEAIEAPAECVTGEPEEMELKAVPFFDEPPYRHHTRELPGTSATGVKPPTLTKRVAHRTLIRAQDASRWRQIGKLPGTSAADVEPPNLSKVVAGPTPIRANAASRRRQIANLMEVFDEEIIPAFTDITSFKMFARSADGLGLHKSEIQRIVATHKKIEDQKIEMLWKWEELEEGEEPILRILEILQNYKIVRDMKSTSRDRHPAAPQKETATHSSSGRETLDTVYVEEIIPAFPDTTSFKMFALSKDGLHLHYTDVQNIVKVYNKVEEAELEMLWKWEEFKDGVSISRIREILQNFQDLQLTKKLSTRLEQPPTAPPDPTATHSTGNAIIIFNLSDKHLHSYKPSGRSWAQMQEFSGTQFTVTIHCDYIYQISGIDVHRLKYVEPTAEWIPLPELNRNHDESACATGFKDSVYVRGGLLQHESFPCIEKYNNSSDEWVARSNTKTVRCLVSTKDVIYCIGVDDEEGDIVGSSEIILGAEWKYINPLQKAYVVCATVLGDLIYVVCGEEGNEIQCYDIENDSWVNINIVDHWPFERPVKILTVNEKLYLIGKKLGSSSSKFPDSKLKSESSRPKYAIYSLDATERRLNLVEEINGKEIYVPVCLSACIE